MTSSEKLIFNYRFVQKTLARRIETSIKNVLCKPCQEENKYVIIYPNGNKYCSHKLRECDKRYSSSLKKMTYMVKEEMQPSLLTKRSLTSSE